MKVLLGRRPIWNWTIDGVVVILGRFLGTEQYIILGQIFGRMFSNIAGIFMCGCLWRLNLRMIQIHPLEINFHTIPGKSFSCSLEL